MDAIIVRRDVQGKLVVFFPDSYNRQAGQITYWSGEAGSKEKITTSSDYYFTSKPAEENEIKDMLAKYIETFQSKEVIVRRRLIKEHVMARTSEHMNSDAQETGRTSEEVKAERAAFVNKLKAAINKALDEALAA